MDICAIIAEFNPFHNGHAYLIRQARQMGAGHIVAVMSGNFVQRGEAAIAEKRVRTRAALSGGADLVLELPLPYACATAERFSYGAVSILASLGCVDSIVFGSERGDIAVLQRAAGLLEDRRLSGLLRSMRKEGITFAKARQTAIAEIGGEEIAELFASPNNILAIEYLLKLRQLAPSIRPLTVPRASVSHDSGRPAGGFASASYLRKAFSPEELDAYTPCGFVYEDAVKRGMAPARMDRLETAILARLRGLNKGRLTSLPDLSEGLENRLHWAIRQAGSLDELYSLVKSKRYTLARVRRLILSAFLGIPGNFCRVPPPYLRILGMNNAGRDVLGKAKPSVPLSASPARLEEQGGIAADFVRLEAASTDLYALALPKPFPMGYEYTESGVYVT